MQGQHDKASCHIRKEFLTALPADNSEDSMRDFPHSKEQITKQVVMSKFKAVRVKFHQAVDSGRRSGHGRVVLLYYELCEQLWGGSPATEQIESGLESADLMNDDTACNDCQENSLNDTQGNSQEIQDTENNLGDANNSDGDVDNSEDNGDVSRSNDDNEQPLATQQPASNHLLLNEQPLATCYSTTCLTTSNHLLLNKLFHYYHYNTQANH